MKKLSSFFSSDKFSSFLATATMWSKYVIAISLLFITWQWNFLVPFLISIVGSFLVGLLFRMIAPKLVWLAKYIVTVGELAILQWYSQAITKSLVITIVFMLPFLFLVVTETMKKAGKGQNNPIVKVVSSLTDKVYGLERVSRLTLGAYFSFVFGLQSMVNECVLLWSFGLIGSVEIDARELVDKCKRVTRYRVVYVPENCILATIEAAREDDFSNG